MTRPSRLAPVLALLCLTAACSGQPPAPPAVRPSATLSATATAAPTLDPPTEAAVLWVQAIDHAYATGDTVPAAELSYLPVCVECRRLIAEVRRINGRGYRVTGGQLTPHGATRLRNPECAKYRTCESEEVSPLIAVNASVTELRVTGPDGKPDGASGKAIPAMRIELWMHQYSGKWRAFDVTIDAL